MPKLKPIRVFVDEADIDVIAEVDIIIASGRPRKNLRTRIPKNLQTSLIGETGSKNQIFVCQEFLESEKEESEQNEARRRGTFSRGEDPRSPRLPVNCGPDKRVQRAVAKTLKEGNNQPNRVGKKIITVTS